MIRQLGASLKRRAQGNIRGEVLAALVDVLRPYRRRTLRLVALQGPIAAVSLLPPLVYLLLVEAALERTEAWPILLGAVALLAIAGIGAILEAASVRLATRLGAQVVADLRDEAFAMIQSYPLPFFTRTPAGATSSRIVNDVPLISRLVSNAVPTLANSLAILAIALGFALWINPWLVTAVLLFAPALIAARLLGERSQRIALSFVIARSNLSAGLTSAMSVDGHLRSLALVGLGPQREEVARLSGTEARTAGDLEATRRMYVVWFGVVAAAATGGGYVIGLLLVIYGRASLAEVVALAAVLVRLQQPLASIMSLGVVLREASVALLHHEEFRTLAERVGHASEQVSVQTENPKGAAEVNEAWAAEVDDLWFSYPSALAVTLPTLRLESDLSPSGGDVLRGVSFTLPVGTCTALVGGSGSGKSTLAQLMRGLLQPTRGSIVIGGIPVGSVDLDALRSTVGLVSQDALIGNGSVRDNLLAVRPDASDRDIIEVCMEAEIHNVICHMPSGYETFLGERGYHLSSGERQRLALAQVLLLDPPFAIFDEVTAHLDATTEAAILPTLTRVASGRTVLLVSHRPSTVAVASRFLELRMGQVSEVEDPTSVVSR